MITVLSSLRRPSYVRGLPRATKGLLGARKRCRTNHFSSSSTKTPKDAMSFVGSGLAMSTLFLGAYAQSYLPSSSITALEGCGCYFDSSNEKGTIEDEDDEDLQEKQQPKDSKNDIPSYVPEMYRDELGGALNHSTEISAEAKYRLAAEAQYPVVKAEMTLAPHVPPPVNRKHPVHLVADIICENKMMNIIGNTKFEYWPFGFYDQNEKKVKLGVPGPFIRARVGDVLQVNFTNKDESGMAHSIDFHAVCGPGGGAPTTFAEQDETKTGAYLLDKPGIFVYHCAAAPIPVHIHNGMFGLILVEPAEGLPPVDKEFYVMQHELYATKNEEDNTYDLDFDGASKEIPRHVLFNGREGSLTDRALQVKQTDTVRIFFGNAGPNLISSFHVIGAIFDKVYRDGDLVSQPARNVQTTLVGAGSATVVELNLPVPGTHSIVDHSINRLDKGAVGFIKVKGKPRPDIYDSAEPLVYCPGCKVHQ